MAISSVALVVIWKFMYAYQVPGQPQTGTLNFIRLTYPDGKVVVPRNKDLITNVPKGTTYHQQAGGGGGYGDPHKRDRAKLREEVRDGVVTLTAAQKLYGL